MSYSTDVRLAQHFATVAHRGQKDKAGKPYIYHPMRVAARMSSEEEKVVAWLHDTVEDTNLCIADVEAAFGAETASAVLAITRQDNEDWNQYLLRVKENEVARKVKISDLIDNSNLSRLKQVTPNDVLRQQKYNKALLFLFDK